MKKPTYKEVQVARKVLVASGIIDTFWHKNDIEQRAEERGLRLTPKQVQGIADLLVKSHDANEGINWDIIDIVTDLYLKNYKK